LRLGRSACSRAELPTAVFLKQPVEFADYSNSAVYSRFAAPFTGAPFWSLHGRSDETTTPLRL
jgi:hypothetical protein